MAHIRQNNNDNNNNINKTTTTATTTTTQVMHKDNNDISLQSHTIEETENTTPNQPQTKKQSKSTDNERVMYKTT